MKNLAIIIPTLQGGGAERVVSILTRELINRYNVYILVFDSSNIAYDYSGELITVDIAASQNFIMKLYNFFLRFWKIRKLKKELSIDVSISFLGSANILNIMSKQNDKTIVSVRSMPSKAKSNLYTKLDHLTIKYLYSRSDKIIAISEGVYNDLISNFGIKPNSIEFIYNPITLDGLEQENVEESGKQKKRSEFKIVTAGRLSDAKGQWHLIRAMKRVLIKVPEAKLDILGEGELRSYLQELIDNLKINDSVKLIGHKKNPFEYYTNSDVFVFTSLHEGFGNVILEAMACNMPVISTDCETGPREIISPNTKRNEPIKEPEISDFGILVPVCDGKKYGFSEPLTEEEIIIANNIINLYKNPSLRRSLAINGKKRVAEFSSKIIAEKWIFQIELDEDMGDKNDKSNV
ncbi:MAG: glycosyltransferase [Firmicutes bacterium]|nr:glycosyltransferase [Bacillota bacterium]